MESAWVSARGYISKLQRMRHDSIKNEQVMSHTTAGRSNSRTHQIERSELGSLGGTLIKTCCYSYGGCPPNPRARFARFNLADDPCDSPCDIPVSAFQLQRRAVTQMSFRHFHSAQFSSPAQPMLPLQGRKNSCCQPHVSCGATHRID